MRLLKLFRLPFFLAVLVALAAGIAGSWAAALLGLGAAGAIFVLGRDPDRQVPSRPLGVVSPVDGQVTTVGAGRDPFLGRDAVLIGICQGVLSPAVLHSPVEGRVEHIWAGPQAAEDGGAPCMAIHLRTDEGDDVVFAVSKARLSGPLQWKVQPGERVGQGQRRGLAGWGRTIRVFLPPASRAGVESGESVRAGADVIARLVHKG